MEGIPPIKRINSTGEFRHTVHSNERVGIDLGTSTIAVASKEAVELKELIKVNTIKYRASQYNHVTNNYKKKKLSQRWTFVDKEKIQRDLYSAFLLMCAENRDKPNKSLCEKEFENFTKLHNECIKNLENSSENLRLAQNAFDF